MKHLLEKFNIPRYVKGKSFAEMSKSIKKRFEGLEDDSDSQSELKETMARLRDMQDHVKKELGLDQPDGAVDGASDGANQFAYGGMTDPVTDPKKKKTNATTDGETRDLTPEELAKAVEDQTGEYVEFNSEGMDQLFGTRDKLAGEYAPLNYGKYKGGNMFTEEVSSTGQYTLSPSKTNIRNSGAHRETIKYLQQLNPEANILNNGSNYGYKQMSERSEGSLFNTGAPKAEVPVAEAPKAMGGYKSSHMSSFDKPMHKFELGGYNSDDLFKQGAFGKDSGASGMDKAGAVMGGANVLMDIGKDVFGDTGVDTSGRSGNIDTSGAGVKAGGAALKGAAAGMGIAGPGGAVVGGLLAGAGSLFGSGRKNEEAVEADTNFSYIKSLENNDVYGSSKTYESAYGGYKKLSHGGPVEDHSDPTSPNFSVVDAQKEYDVSSIVDIEKTASINKGREKKDGYDPSELLRYAGVATDAYQLATIKKPEDASVGQDNTKYKKQFIDEQSIQNTVREGTSNVRDAIVSSSGGSGASARASLLASQVIGTKALSDSSIKAKDLNNQENRNAQAFDSATNRYNIGQQEKSDIYNAQNKAAYENQRSKFISSIGDSLGEIGLESKRLKTPAKAGFYYDANGKLIKKKK